MRKIFSETTLWLGMLFASILIGATIYQMLVIVPEFARDIPNGMTSFARGTISPKAFWASPIMAGGFLFSILALIMNWKTPRRKWLMRAVLFWVAAEVLTVFYVYPMLRIMGIFDGNPSAELDLLTNTIRKWILVDQFRFWLLAMPAYFFYVKALTVNPSEN